MAEVVAQIRRDGHTRYVSAAELEDVLTAASERITLPTYGPQPMQFSAQPEPFDITSPKVRLDFIDGEIRKIRDWIVAVEQRVMQLERK